MFALGISGPQSISPKVLERPGDLSKQLSYSNYRRPYYQNGGYYARAHSYRSGLYARTNSRDGASYARANTRAGGSYAGANIRGGGTYARANAREGGSYGARPQHVRNSTTHHQSHGYER
jgi:hypothetical protein